MTNVSVGFEYCHYLNKMFNFKMSQESEKAKVHTKFPFEKNNIDFPWIVFII